MKIAYGVELAESVRKTEDKSDRANYGVWIRQSQYYGVPFSTFKALSTLTVRQLRGAK